MEESSKTVDVVALPGDGIGPEVMAQGLSVLGIVAGAAGLAHRVTKIPCGGGFYLQHGKRDWPEGSEKRCEEADLILLGAVGWPDETGGPVTMENGRMAGWSPVIGNRTRLNLFANVRPVKLFPGVSHRISGRQRQVWEPKDVDLVIVRENTEGLYSGIGGFEESEGRVHRATDTRLITREASERVIRFAFELSLERGRGAPADGKKRVTCIVKDNVLFGCKLFASVFREVGAEYPEIEKELAIVDAFTQWLIFRPEHYDVCVTTNMFGDIVTDLASVLQGGMGLSVGANIGEDHAMFEPIHGSAPAHAGKNEANPMAMILAVGEGLRWLARRRGLPRLHSCAAMVEAAVAAVLLRGSPLTYDLAPEGLGRSTSEVGQAITAELRSLLDAGSTA